MESILQQNTNATEIIVEAALFMPRRISGDRMKIPRKSWL
jgi:hypothetical protein